MAEARFAYHRAVAPMLWVLVGIALLELVVVHLLVAHWSRTAALALSIVTLGSVAWLVSAILSFRRLPVLVTADAVVMRAGTLKGVTIPLAAIAGLRENWTGEDVKRRDVLNLALIAYPNVLIDLRAPLPGRRGIVAVAHRLDDPAAFVAALAHNRPSPESEG